MLPFFLASPVLLPLRKTHIKSLLCYLIQGREMKTVVSDLFLPLFFSPAMFFFFRSNNLDKDTQSSKQNWNCIFCCPQPNQIIFFLNYKFWLNFWCWGWCEEKPQDLFFTFLGDHMHMSNTSFKLRLRSRIRLRHHLWYSRKLRRCNCSCTNPKNLNIADCCYSYGCPWKTIKWC